MDFLTQEEDDLGTPGKSKFTDVVYSGSETLSDVIELSTHYDHFNYYYSRLLAQKYVHSVHGV